MDGTTRFSLTKAKVAPRHKMPPGINSRPLIAANPDLRFKDCTLGLEARQ
jgi:hypothetical protein